MTNEIYIFHSFIFIFHFFLIENERVHLHLFEHGEEAVAAGGREVFAQAYLFDEVEVGIKNLLWRMVAEDADEQGDNALDNQGVALCLKVDKAGGSEVGGQPHTALATLDEVLLRLGAGG